MRFFYIIPYIVASAIILTSLPGGGAFAHPLGEELSSAKKLDETTGRTLIKFALLDGRAILGSRTQLCDCCSEHNNNDSDCCGDDFYGTCSCYCCDGCAADEAGDLMRLVAAKKRAAALKEAQLKEKRIDDAVIGAHDLIVKKQATTLAGAAMDKKSASPSGTPRALDKVGEAKAARAQDHATAVVKNNAANVAFNASLRGDDLALSHGQEQMAKKDGMFDGHAALHERAAHQDVPFGAAVLH